MQISSYFTQFTALASASLLPYGQSAPPIGTGKSRDEKVAGQTSDELHLSEAALAADEQATAGKSIDGSAESTQNSGSNGRLTEEQRREVQELRQRDQQVRRHEQAHLAAAGPNARGGPTFEYVVGPDNRRYAVGGEVQIDTSAVPDDPEATIQKARAIRAASLAPADPSAQDRSVAAAASKLEADSRRELTDKQRTEKESDAGSTSLSGSLNPLASTVVASSVINPAGRAVASGKPESRPTPQAAAAYQAATRGLRLDLIA